MAQRGDQRQQRKRGPAPGGPIRKRNCYFCREKVEEVDYKNMNQLRRYVSEKGKIRSRRITGACRRHQRQVAAAVKRAREMALLPYSTTLMQVILRQDVDKLGLRGDVVDVAPGYARNFLLPRKLAETATAAKVAEVRKHEEKRAKQEAQSVEQAQEIVARLEADELRFDVPAGETGTLFGSVTATNIVEEVWSSKKTRIDRRKVDLADPIKRIGRYEIPVVLFGDVSATLRVAVVPEGGELPPQEELDAIAAAEAEAEAAAQAEAEAEHAQAEAVIEAVVAEEEEPAGRGRRPSRRRRPRSSRRLARARLRAPGFVRRSLATPTMRGVPALPVRPFNEKRTAFSTGADGPVEFITNFPLGAGKSPTGVVRGSWEHAFPYACKSPSPDTSGPVESRVVQTFRARFERGLVTPMAQLAQASQTAPVPPQNLEAEESVLGAMMLSPGAIGAVSEVLDGRGLLPRKPRQHLPRGARPLRPRRARRRDHARRRARGARRARGRRAAASGSTSSQPWSRQARTPGTTRASCGRWPRSAG